ncbi:MAG: putative O-methyltransferase YrrM, partial [Saprospiraceae bacterium]
NVLEIGTKIRCSSLFISLALNNSGHTKLTTIDIVNVNNPIEKHWLKFDSLNSPLEMMTSIGFGKQVAFVTNNSIAYMTKTK